MGIARYFREDKHDGRSSFPGVPLRDITDDEWEVLPEHWQRSVDASELYQKTNPAPEPRRAAPKRDEEATH